jgi:predicted phosphodiesterase
MEENMKILMIHIGSQRDYYSPAARQLVLREKPNIFISGHSHILKVMNDPQLPILQINPGAAGEYGIHTVRTAIRFKLDKGNITELEVGEWPKR